MKKVKIRLFVAIGISIAIGIICVTVKGSDEQTTYSYTSGKTDVPNTMQFKGVHTPSITNQVNMVTAQPSKDANESGTIIKPSKTAKSFDTLTVVKQGKKKTFHINQGVDESTLKKGVGWMESSAKAGEEGICILMGHRNGDFRFLNGLEENDDLIYKFADGSSFSYKVQAVEIIPSDDALRFPVEEGKCLMLVTCYPFRYVGHAPQKFVIKSKLQ